MGALMVAISELPDAALTLTYMEAYMKTYMEAYMEAYMAAHLNAALPQAEVACRMSDRDLTIGAVASHDDGPHDSQEIGFPKNGDMVFLRGDANRNSAKNRFLECFPEVKDVPVVVLVNETDEFLVLMDE